MKTLFLTLFLAFSLGTLTVGCADEVNAEGDINPDEDGDDGADEGAAGMGDPDPEPVDDVDECVASCNDDACAAACRD